MPKIFISYRRADSLAHVGRIYDRLATKFGEANVFMDVDNIPPGADFPTYIQDWITNSDTMLVVIGPRWLKEQDEDGGRRLDNPADFVRVEIETALGRGQSIRIIPVLVDGARMPDVDVLPESLTPLARRNAIPVRNNPDFRRDMERLIEVISAPKHARSTTSAGGIARAVIVIGLALAAIFGISRLLSGVTGMTPPDSDEMPTDTNAPAETAALLASGDTSPEAETLDLEFRAQTFEAEQWTDTPTRDATATFIAFVTQRAGATRTQVALAQTAAADAWTDTPVPTEAAEHTAIPGRPELTAALERARNFSSNNDDWEKFSHTFDSVEMVLVPVGCFQMGTSVGGDNDERPAHQICFSEPFWIDRFEVTNEQFARISSGAQDNSEQAQYPHASITWFEADVFCALRGARLPTEMEWEYAARGPDNLLYPWGNEFISGNAVWNVGGSARVGSKPDGQSWVGAHDLSGNLWEWTSSRYTLYPHPTLASDAEILRSGNVEQTDLIVTRGGAWYSETSSYLRAPDRLGNNPSYKSEWVGFRCARAVSD